VRTIDQVDELQERIRRAPADLIAARIRRARREAIIDGETVKLSHDELKDRMGASNRQHLIKLEKGQHRPGAGMLMKIAEATGRQVEWFLDPELEPSPFPEAA
jgi:transcriptional regulator with XRE-family HTH domain